MIDAGREKFEEVELMGVPALFTSLRVDRSTVPEGMFAYDLQTSPEDWDQPCLIGKVVMVDHMGTILTAQPIALEGGYRSLEPGCLTFRDNSAATLKDFKIKYLPKQRSARHVPGPVR